MYITLTNAAAGHEGNKLAINSDLIATVNHQYRKGEDDIIHGITFIFCPPHGTWEVSESFSHVVDMLNGVAAE